MRATQAMPAILMRMVMFRCWFCNERFQTFHPACKPPAKLLDRLNTGGKRVAPCNVRSHK